MKEAVVMNRYAGMELRWTRRELQSANHFADMQNEVIRELKEQNNRYKQDLELIQRHIYTEHCTLNSAGNDEYEKGVKRGLLCASKIIKRTVEEEERELRE